MLGWLAARKHLKYPGRSWHKFGVAPWTLTLTTPPPGIFSGAKKEPQSQKVTKEFSEQFEGVTGHYRLKQGFWGKSHQKVRPKVRRNLCRKSSLGYLFCPWFYILRFFMARFWFWRLGHPATKSTWIDFINRFMMGFTCWSPLYPK